MSDTAYVTTPIYYVNDRPHLGHVYTTTVADVVAAYHRGCGREAFLLTGVDEHAAKVSDKAAENDMSPQDWADRNAAAFRETFDKLELGYDDFVRTSADRHVERVVAYCAALQATGDIYAGTYEGWYDEGQEEYVPENKAKENDHKSEVTGKPLVRKSEENYFFRLSAYREPLLAHFEAHPDFVKPEARRNEIVNRIREMDDIPISRTGSGGWGIPLPGAEGQTIYVWIDALFNYLTHVDTDDRRHLWASGATHFIAKDILWFHAAIWPALLLALAKCEGYDWVRLPQRVYSHSYWVSDAGEKMSKSMGNFLDPEAIDNYVSEFGLDALRYFLATRGPLGVSDAAFSPDVFIDTYNSELAGRLGNAASRVSNMTVKYFDGVVPDAADDTPVAIGEADQLFEGGFRDAIDRHLTRYHVAFADHDLSGAAAAALDLIKLNDLYIDRTKPFQLAKDPANMPAVGVVLNHCLQLITTAGVMLQPFMPGKAGALLDALKHPDGEARQIPAAGDAAWPRVAPGTVLRKTQALFPRYMSR